MGLECVVGHVLHLHDMESSMVAYGDHFSLDKVFFQCFQSTYVVVCLFFEVMVMVVE
jgi:hypothetical protein